MNYFVEYILYLDRLERWTAVVCVAVVFGFCFWQEWDEKKIKKT